MSLEALMIASLSTVGLTLSLMFLPAAIELAHPMDAGPRLVSDYASMGSGSLAPIVNLEASWKMDYRPVSSRLNLLMGLINLETVT